MNLTRIRPETGKGVFAHKGRRRSLRESLDASPLRTAPLANVAAFGSGDGPGEHLQTLLGRALTLSESCDCDARIRYHLARAAELTAGEDGGAVQTLPGGAN